MSAYRSRHHDFVLRWYEFEYSRIVLRVVRLHRLRCLRARKAEAQVELTDVLDASAVLKVRMTPSGTLLIVYMTHSLD
jgi:hypothetical protein